MSFQVFTAEQHRRWERGEGGTPVASGRCPSVFTPPRNGTYYVKFTNEYKNKPVTLTFVIRFIATWRYYDVVPPNPVRPYVNGTPGTPSRDFFRLFALYKYWLDNRDRLINETRRQVGNFSKLARDVDALLALSLAALLREAGFNVSFAAVRTDYVTDWEDPLTPSSVVLLVKFHSSTAPNATFWKIYRQIPAKPWVWTYQRPSAGGFDYYVLVDTSTQVFDVVYIDEVTKLP